jgi:cytosine permease
LLPNTAGIASTLVTVGAAAIVTAMVGVRWAIVAGAIAAVFGGILGWLLGHVAYVSGTSSTVTMRYYGLGTKGSALASLIFAFMIIGMLALENALLYYGTLFAFGWDPSLLNAIVIYAILTACWIAIATYGMRVIQATSTVLLLLFLVLAIAVAGIAVSTSGRSLMDILMSGPPGPGAAVGQVFATAVAVLAGVAGALALVDADYARYARSTKDVGILAVGGSVISSFVVTIIGAVIVEASRTTVTAYLAGHAAVANAQMGTTIADKVGWMIDHNIGAYFIVLFGITGFILMYIAQIKAQALNAYSGSLSLSNLVNGLTGRHLSRVSLVIICNIIALLMIVAGILDLFGRFLSTLGIVTVAVAAVVIADYYIVRKCRTADSGKVEAVNWPGVVAVIIGTVAGAIFSGMGITPLGFVITLVVVLVLYPLMQWFALPRSTALR